MERIGCTTIIIGIMAIKAFLFFIWLTGCWDLLVVVIVLFTSVIIAHVSDKNKKN